MCQPLDPYELDDWQADSMVVAGYTPSPLQLDSAYWEASPDGILPFVRPVAAKPRRPRWLQRLRVAALFFVYLLFGTALVLFMSSAIGSFLVQLTGVQAEAANLAGFVTALYIWYYAFNRWLISPIDLGEGGEND